MKSIQAILSGNLGVYVKKDGRNQADIADLAEMSTRGLQKVLSGESWPRIENIVSLCEVLGINQTDLFFDDSMIKKDRPTSADRKIELLQHVLNMTDAQVTSTLKDIGAGEFVIAVSSATATDETQDDS